MPAAWMLQANPAIWRVWDWHNDGAQAEPLTRWTVRRHRQPVAVGDDFALWLTGRDGGVCAIGKITKVPYGPTLEPSDYWEVQPSEPSWGVGIEVTRRFFDPVIAREALAADPGFADAQVLTPPRSGNPFRLTATQWAALMAHVDLDSGAHLDAGALGPCGAPAPGQPIFTTMPLATLRSDSEVLAAAGPLKRTYAETRLLLDYERYLGRPLVRLSKVLAQGPTTRLVCDAYDAQTLTLIEAKKTAGREAVRMAIGQLLDYRRHFPGVQRCALLLPEYPSDDLVDLIAATGLDLIYGKGKTFTSVLVKES